MARDIEFREHAYAAIMRVGNEVSNLCLSVIQTVGSHFVQLRKAFALDPKALVVGKVPVQNIHLHRRHSVQVALEDVERNEMAADVNEQTAPRKEWLVLYCDGRDGESLPGGFHELKQCLKPAQKAKRICRRELRVRLADGQPVRLILSDFLHFLAAMFSLNQQRGIGGVARAVVEMHSRLPGKLGHKPFYAGFQCRIVKTRGCKGKGLINRQLSRTKFHGGRHGHEVKGMPLGSSKSCKVKDHSHDKKVSHVSPGIAAATLAPPL